MSCPFDVLQSDRVQARAALIASQSWLAWSGAWKRLRTLLPAGELEPRPQPAIIPQRVLGAADSLIELDGRIATSRASAAAGQVDALHALMLDSAEMRAFLAADRRLKTRAVEDMAEWSEAEKKKLAAEEAVPRDDWFHALHAAMQCDDRPQRSECEPQSVGAEEDTPPVASGGQVSSVSPPTAIDESEEQAASSAPAGAQEVVSSVAVQSVPVVSHTSPSSSAQPSAKASQAVQLASTVSALGASVPHMPAQTSPPANPIVLRGEPAASTATVTESSAPYAVLASSSFSAPSTPPPRPSHSSTAASTLSRSSVADVQQPSHCPASSTASVTSTSGQVSSSAATMPRSTARPSSARPIAVPAWCRGPMVLDGLQVVPAYRLGLTAEAVWATRWGVSRHQLQRIWSVRGPDSLLAAIIRSEVVDWDTNYEHPSAADIAKLRTDLKKFVSSSSEDEYQACFPAGVEHRTKQAMIELLADPQQWLDAELLYVYYAQSRDQYDMRIYLISVDGVSERQTEFGEELANNDTSCTIIYENLAEQPAHYEAVSSRTAKGRISLKPTRSFSDFAKILKHASRELSRDRSAALKRKAAQPPTGLDTPPKRTQREKGDGERHERGADDQQSTVDTAAGRAMEIE